MLLACIFVPYLGGNLFNQDAILATDYDKNRKLLILKRMISSIIAQHLATIYAIFYIYSYDLISW